MRVTFTGHSAPALLALLACLAAPDGAAADSKVFERALDSATLIISPHEKDNQMSVGSGSLVNAKERIVLTNYHVVGDRDVAIVFFAAYRSGELVTDPEYYSGRVKTLGIAGKVIARSVSRDLALIKIDSIPLARREIRLAARSAKPGETLHAVGNSGLQLGTLWRYSQGEVRQVYVRKYTCGSPPFEVNARIVETQIPINQGDSGGPVLNLASELAAVSQGFQDPSVQELVSNMIDVSEIRAFLKEERLLPQTAPKKFIGVSPGS